MRKSCRASRFATAAAAVALLVGFGDACAREEDLSAVRAAIASAVAQTHAFECPRGRVPQSGRARCVRDPRGLQEALQSLYSRSADSPLWSGEDGPTPQAVELLAALRAVDTYGLRPEDYVPQATAQVSGMPETPPRDAAARRAWSDVELSAAALRLVSDLHFGRIEPQQAGFQLDTPRQPFDLAAAVQRLAGAEGVARVLESVEPQFYHYKLLEIALRRYRGLAQRTGPTVLPAPRKSVRLGDTYAGAPALRRLLTAVGDLPAASGPGSSDLVVDAALASAIARFQTRHGLNPDGVLGKTTYAALAIPPAQRVRQIELTLERWRWLPAFDTPPIIVNIPEFRLFAFQSTADRKASILQMDVIVGKSYRRFQTPVFAADMKYVVFRPYWDIPYSIMLREMLPRIRANPAYLAQQHLEIVAGQTDAARPLPPTSSNIELLAAGKLRLRQQPGADNALGLIKFMLPNHYNVYLHATPAHNLFKESRRAFSHGCIRVSDPVALAEHVLRNAAGEWTRERIQAAMSGSTTQRTNLVKPIRVMILYGTVLATESGDVLFFDDIYGGDRKLEALLGLTPVT
ncbi:MAG TPA: L,D-transpeptidase family protein [Steroidobacteraceae bacterium]|nr:L,D-transpeptidase family protein [Steroidobacteraceae bacterium]